MKSEPTSLKTPTEVRAELERLWPLGWRFKDCPDLKIWKFSAGRIRNRKVVTVHIEYDSAGPGEWVTLGINIEGGRVFDELHVYDLPTLVAQARTWLRQVALATSMVANAFED